MILTSREREKLHKAIHSYLINQNYVQSAETLEREAGITADLSLGDQLEKKWSAVVRLQ